MSRKNYALFGATLLTISLMIGGPALASRESGKHFGAPFTGAKRVKLADAISDAEKYAGKPVKIEGEIRDVCQMKGCWLVVTDGEKHMRVTFKDYGFFVPKESTGKRVVLEGVIEKKTITEDHARHLAEESKEKINPETIKGPQQVVTLVATGVSIEE
ncbi:MAG TPA: DUF4920 domain-containing protein [Blastocatellia bacterium]|nr:DUF4920 domain-containing protein [Blastocatellia bacterium]